MSNSYQKNRYISTLKNQSFVPLGKECKNTQPPSALKLSLLRRLERFELLSIVSYFLKDVTYKTRKGSLRSPAVCDCMSLPRKKYVEVWKSVKNSLAYYSKLVTCHSVWDCPVCAQKVSEHRASEIRQAVDSWESQGGSVSMLTLTFPHYAFQHCKSLRDLFQSARRTFKNRPSYKSLMKNIGYVGDINRTEVTYGSNGWHIHCHTLIFHSSKIALSSSAFFPLWLSACKIVGLPVPSDRHGVSVATPKQKAEYISKQGNESSNWGIEKEMTKGHIKKGGREGLTPFDLIRAFRDSQDEKYKILFVEYSQTFKGTRQLVWSDGLRSLLLLSPELTDQEVVDSQDEFDSLLAMLDLKLWSYIRKNNYRGQLLEAANISPEMFSQAIDVLKSSAGLSY